VDFSYPLTDTFELASRMLASGEEGDPRDVLTYKSFAYGYPEPGDYTATLTDTDVLGRVRTASAKFRVTTAYVPAPYIYGVVRTIPAHGTTTIFATELDDDHDESAVATA
jgi:hypothetical protein